VNYHDEMPWLVQSIRFTSFLMPEAPVPPETWGAVVGGEPENTIHQRAVALRQDSGSFLDAAATLTVLPGRIDWVFMPLQTAEPGFATLGPFPVAAERHLAAMSQWVRSERFPATRRLALGIVLVEPTETRESGYERLRHFIDAVPRGEASDFLYQVNRYRASTTDVPELKVNRLAKWSVSQVRMVVVTGGASTLAAPVSFVHLDLDVSSSAEFAGAIPPGSLGAVLDDLRAGASEIATHGDHLG
jgi:hypothetical protein